MRSIRKEESKRAQARPQRQVLRDVMFSASECGTWLTLDELAKLTHYPPASISAQLRHLRKAEYGGFLVEKRRREVDEVPRQDFGVVWEYRLTHGNFTNLRSASNGTQRRAKAYGSHLVC